MDNSRNAIIITNSRPTFFEWMVMGPKGNYRLIVASLSFRFVVGLITVSCLCRNNFPSTSYFPLFSKPLLFLFGSKSLNGRYHTVANVTHAFGKRRSTIRNENKRKRTSSNHGTNDPTTTATYTIVIEREIIIFISSSLSSCSSKTH